MINSIKLQGVASYSQNNPVTIAINGKKINLFYGLNGSGKSTLGNYLQSPQNPKFQHCQTLPVAISSNIFVYNQQFVKQNFHESAKQPGIFTLSEENKEAEEAIEAANLAIKDSKEATTAIQDKVLSKRKEIEEIETKLTNKVWPDKKKYDSSSLEYCLSGAKQKSSFLEKIKNSNGATERTIAELIKEAEELNGQDAAERANVEQVLFGAFDIEAKQIFRDRIVGSGDSYLASMIKKLDNVGWIQQGVQYINEDGPCPFCQQNLPSNFQSAVAQLFDESYQQQRDELVKLKNTYVKEVKELVTTLNSGVYQADYALATPEYSSLKETLVVKFNTNVELLNRKCSDPSESVSLTDCGPTLARLNSLIRDISAKVTAFNDKIRNKRQYLNNIKNQFWQILHNRWAESIESAKNESNKLEGEKTALNQSIKDQEAEITRQEKIIVENRKKVTNIDSAVVNINTQLKSLGLQGFELKSVGEQSPYYKIVRQSEGEDIYKTLSEGEKTLITFLYFLEHCTGTVDQDSAFVLGDRIVVIDDPISSLSHNFVYDVASLIHHEVIQRGFKQVFILTHNLFFYHELLMLKQPKGCPSNYKLYRVSKSDCSHIEEMERTDIQNDYQNYWQVIKDSLNNSAYANMLPNAMRNILEYYFNFVHQKGNLKTVLKELGSTEAEFKPLFRYINRASHSDAINISDFENIEVQKYVDKFECIFKKTGFGEHYNKMMGTEIESN